MPSLATVRSLFSWSCAATSLAVSNFNTALPRNVADRTRHRQRNDLSPVFHASHTPARFLAARQTRIEKGPTSLVSLLALCPS
jgi:hypothetical protein